MKNKLTDLNDHLFMALERLNEEGLSDEQVQIEVKRAKAVADVGSQISGIASIQLDAAKLIATHGQHMAQNLPMLPKPEAGK
jgi:hypothetical protein